MPCAGRWRPGHSLRAGTDEKIRELGYCEAFSGRGTFVRSLARSQRRLQTPRFSMKNLSALFLAAGLALTLGSCQKDDSTATPANTTPTPPSPTITRVGSTVMAGTLASIRMSYEYTVPQVNVTVPIEIESAVAAFFGSSGSSFVDAGAVAVNTNGLDKQSNNAYVKAGNFSATTTGQTGTSLGFDTGSSWTVAGSGSVPAFSYNHTADMPDYSGTLPTSITKSAGLTLPLLITGSDSTYVLIAAGNKQLLKRVGRASSVAFTAAELGTLPTVTNNTALIEVVPFKYSVVTLGGKPYAFVKEYAAVGNVNIQ